MVGMEQGWDRDGIPRGHKDTSGVMEWRKYGDQHTRDGLIVNVY